MLLFLCRGLFHPVFPESPSSCSCLPLDEHTKPQLVRRERRDTRKAECAGKEPRRILIVRSCGIQSSGLVIAQIRSYQVLGSPFDRRRKRPFGSNFIGVSRTERAREQTVDMVMIMIVTLGLEKARLTFYDMTTVLNSSDAMFQRHVKSCAACFVLVWFLCSQILISHSLFAETHVSSFSNTQSVRAHARAHAHLAYFTTQALAVFSKLWGLVLNSSAMPVSTASSA
nr:hypothetical protein CFP56_10454 [Quercus suber]